MEKVIELLNEYEKRTVVHWYEWYWQDVLMCRYIKDNFEFYTDEATTIAISKYYWFIKWLVDKDKIDVESYCRITSVERKWEKDVYRDEVDSLIMLLAIQNEPIEFLISVLK